MFFYDDNNDNVPITFSIEEKQINNNNDVDINIIEKIIYNTQENEIHSTDYYLPQLDMIDNENDNFFYDYNKYTLKELFKICDYYGFAKELKTNKCNKKEIIQYLIEFENDYNNIETVYTRRNMWFYMNELKKEPLMKKFIIW